jgi:hypothetical protein
VAIIALYVCFWLGSRCGQRLLAFPGKKPWMHQFTRTTTCREPTTTNPLKRWCRIMHLHTRHSAWGPKLLHFIPICSSNTFWTSKRGQLLCKEQNIWMYNVPVLSFG